MQLLEILKQISHETSKRKVKTEKQNKTDEEITGKFPTSRKGSLGSGKKSAKKKRTRKLRGNSPRVGKVAYIPEERSGGCPEGHAFLALQKEKHEEITRKFPTGTQGSLFLKKYLVDTRKAMFCSRYVRTRYR